MSSLSLTDEQLEELKDQFKLDWMGPADKRPRRDGYVMLSPTHLGYGFRTHNNEQCHVLKLEAPEPPKIEKKPGQPMGHYQYEAQLRLRMVLDCEPSYMDRFHMQPDDFEFALAKRIQGFTFEEMMQWIHRSTKGRFSIRCLMHRRREPGKSAMIVYFERAEDATIFKVFRA